jgi:hypothetical protein
VPRMAVIPADELQVWFAGLRRRHAGGH